jgi:hypothetical protein
MNRGLGRERRVASLLREAGYLVASLRHFKGAGDLLAIAPYERAFWPNPLIIEVKGTTEAPWRSTFGPADRHAMIEAGKAYGAEPLLAWWPTGLGGPIFLTPEDWPR